MAQFWIIKALTTAIGETPSDFLAHDLAPRWPWPMAGLTAQFKPRYCTVKSSLWPTIGATDVTSARCTALRTGSSASGLFPPGGSLGAQ